MAACDDGRAEGSGRHPVGHEGHAVGQVDRRQDRRAGGPPPQRVLHGHEQPAAGVGDAAAQHHQLGVHGLRQQRHRARQVPRHGVQDRRGLGVALPCRGQQGRGGGDRAVGGRPPGGDGRSRRHRLEAAALAALAQRAVGIDGQVTDLAGGAVRPAADVPVEQEAGGQARADAQVGQVATTAEGDSGAHRGQVHVVVDDDRRAGESAQVGDERHGVGVEAQVHRVANRPGAAVDQAGNAEPDSGEPVDVDARGLRQGGQHLGRGRQQRFAPPDARGPADGGDDAGMAAAPRAVARDLGPGGRGRWPAIAGGGVQRGDVDRHRQRLGAADVEAGDETTRFRHRRWSGETRR